jgi:hypothetical protein
MNPPFHPPSVCPSANLSSFHLPHTETRQWGPHPSSVFPEILPSLRHSFHTGAPVSVFCTSFPHLFIISCTNTFFTSLCFCRHHWRPAFLFWPHATHVTLGWSITSHFPLPTSSISSEYHPGKLPLPSAFIHLVPPLAQLTLDLVVPMALDLVQTVAATPYIIHPPTKGSLESSHFLTSSMYLRHVITSVDSTEYPFCFSESRLPFVDISTLFQKGGSILVLISHLMSDLGRHRGKHHCSRMSLTPITFDANTFSCCGGSYFATIAVFIINCRRPLNLVGPPLPTSLSLFTSATITTGSEYVPLQNCLLPLSFRPRGRCSRLHQQFRHFLFRVTSHEHGACPPRLYTFVYCFHTLRKVGSTGSFLLQRIALYGLTLALPYNTILRKRNIDEFRLYVWLLTSSIRGHLLSLKFRPHRATRTPHRQHRKTVIHGTRLILQHSKRVKTIQNGPKIKRRLAPTGRERARTQHLRN